jgi:hypothetical protein
MSGLSGFNGHLFHNESRWRRLSSEEFRYALLHAPRDLAAHAASQRKYGEIYRLFSERCPAGDRRLFVEALDHKEQGDWGEPERFWTVIVEDHDMEIVRLAAACLTRRLGAEAVRTRAYRLRAAHHERAQAVLDGASQEPPMEQAS